MENVRNRQKNDPYTDEENIQNAINKVTFNKPVLISEHLILINKYKITVYFSKPIYIGQAVLDLSKLLMYDFHYELIAMLMKEFIGLKSKSNSYRKKKYFYALKNACLITKKNYHHKQSGIRSYKHELYTVEINKQSLNKTYILYIS